ncbi:MAG: hypothetical protein D6706_13585 [Chloroflexi bacterium]|nr:MAG: hypothetical protein D6706_13585 [Chloroflexota bacterium]
MAELKVVVEYVECDSWPEPLVDLLAGYVLRHGLVNGAEPAEVAGEESELKKEGYDEPYKS